MLRPRAVRSLLLDVAGLRTGTGTGTGEAEGLASGGESETHDRAVLRQSARRALLVALVDALAIALLFLLRDRSRSFLVLERSPDAVFSVGVLLVAMHLGFRLAQALQLRRVLRALDDLPDASPAEQPGARQA
jgi:hypothetical protein